MIVALTACQTPYQDFGGAVIGGVSAEQTGYDRYRVSAQVNANTPSSWVIDYLRLKAAETTVQNGATHFVVEGFTEANSVQTLAMPGMVNCWGYGCVVTPASVQQNVLPGAVLLMRIVKGAPSSDAIEAKEIIDTVGRRVKRGQKG